MMKHGKSRWVLFAVLLAAVLLLSAPVAVVGMYAFGALIEQNQPDEWILNQIENRIGVDFGDGEWGTCEKRVFGGGRDYYLEAVVNLTKPLGAERLAALESLDQWKRAPAEEHLVGELISMGAVSETTKESICAVLETADNMYYQDLRRSEYGYERFDVCAVDLKANKVYVVCLDF